MQPLRLHLLQYLGLALAVSTAAGQTPTLTGLKERWGSAAKSLRIPGVAIVAVRGDEVLLLESIGNRNLQQQPVTPDTIFYIASCTKTYVAMRLGQLAAAGRVDLDAPVKQYLPRFRLADTVQTEKLTVRDLLTHRQGLHSGPIVLLDAYTGEINDDRYYHFLRQVQPRGKCEYSNIHFTLAGRIIESVEGKNWRDALQDELFQPTGMTRTTGYASRMYGDEDFAEPMQIKGASWAATAVRKTDRTMHAAGGLGTTARDLGRWLRININGGAIDGQRILSREGITAMHVLQVNMPQKSPFPEYQEEGFGFAWQVGSFKGRKHVSHGGGYAGTTALVSFMPDEKIGLAILCNMGGHAGAFARVVMLDVYSRLLPTEVDDPLPGFLANAKSGLERLAAAVEPEPLAAADLSLPIAKYAGVYENSNFGTLRIDHQDNRLIAKLGDLPLQFKSVGIDRLEVRGGPANWSATFELEGEDVRAISIQIAGTDGVPFLHSQN